MPIISSLQRALFVSYGLEVRGGSFAEFEPIGHLLGYLLLKLVALGQANMGTWMGGVWGGCCEIFLVWTIVLPN